MYSTFCYLLTSLHCLNSCEFLVFYICLARVRYYFYYYLPYNSFIHYIGLNENNSLSHLLETISPDMEDESNIIERSKFYDDTDFKDALQQYNSKISILSLSCKSINAKYGKLKLFLDDVNTLNPISIICVQESWCHDEIDIN